MITFYAKARNQKGKIEQILVTKEPGEPTSPQWTGKSTRATARPIPTSLRSTSR
jgi:hypothetical protein